MGATFSYFVEDGALLGSAHCDGLLRGLLRDEVAEALEVGGPRGEDGHAV